MFITSAKEVRFHSFVSQQDSSKTPEPISMKCGGRLEPLTCGDEVLSLVEGGGEGGALAQRLLVCDAFV